MTMETKFMRECCAQVITSDTVRAHTRADPKQLRRHIDHGLTRALADYLVMNPRVYRRNSWKSAEGEVTQIRMFVLAGDEVTTFADRVRAQTLDAAVGVIEETLGKFYADGMKAKIKRGLDRCNLEDA
jgi:hypothetical protein